MMRRAPLLPLPLLFGRGLLARRVYRTSTAVFGSLSLSATHRNGIVAVQRDARERRRAVRYLGNPVGQAASAGVEQLGFQVRHGRWHAAGIVEFAGDEIPRDRPTRRCCVGQASPSLGSKFRQRSRKGPLFVAPSTTFSQQYEQDTSKSEKSTQALKRARFTQTKIALYTSSTGLLVLNDS